MGEVGESSGVGRVGRDRLGNGSRRSGRRPWLSRARDSNLEPADDTPQQKTYFYVKGYPANTSVQEVVEAFGEYLPVKVAEQHAWGMMLYTEQEGGLRDLPPLTINGQPVRVINRGPDGKQRRCLFPRSKQNSVVIDPRDIVLEGPFRDQFCNVLEAVRVQPERVEQLYLLYDHIEEVLSTVWPDCVALPFGSIISGLGMANSDADCFVTVPDEFYRADGQLVNKAERALRRYPHYFTEILAITGASTPIVKLLHLPTGFNCDISFKSALGVQNTNLIGTLMQVNCALLPCMLGVKYWARVHDLSGPGRLSNYALTLMFLFYIQVQRKLIPSISYLQQDPECEVEVSGWNAGFTKPEQLTEDVPIRAVLGGFFTFYSEFDFERFVISPFAGKPVEKSVFASPETLPAVFALYAERLAEHEVTPLKFARPVCVQDPFDHTHNVASAISNNVLSNIKENIAFAAAAFDNDLDNECEGFLKKILLDGPPRPKAKKPSAALSIRYPMARRVMIEAEWREAMVTATTTILGTMLLLELAPHPTKHHKRHQLHSWETALFTPIWKRKRFNNLYSKMNFGYIETQTRITREVIAVNKEELFLRMAFQLRLKGPATSPRATLTLHYQDGDIDAFVEMKGFLSARLKGWLRNVLRIQLEMSGLQEVFEEGEAIAINEAASRATAAAAAADTSDSDSDSSGSSSCEDDEVLAE